jgi:hypothetical protein
MNPFDSKILLINTQYHVLPMSATEHNSN